MPSPERSPDPTALGTPFAAVVVNPSGIDVRVLRAAVTTEQESSGWADTRWFETDRDDDGRAAARAAGASGAAVVLVAGGDGTLRVAAEELHETGIPIALVPTGTGNLYARNLGLRLNDVTGAVRRAFHGTDRPVDIAFADLTTAEGVTTRHAFLVMAGIGLDASMAANTNARAKKWFGWVAYSDPIARSVIGNRRIELRYRLDDAPERSMRAHTVIVGNCGTLTAGVLLLPAARPDDGVLDAVAFRPDGALGWTKVGYGLSMNRFHHRTRFGRLLAWFLPKSRALGYTTARRLQVTLDEPQQVQLDGDPFGTVVGTVLTVRHGGLTLRGA
ncbi:diacylglycerol kinase family protein [Curtobacterium sp. MCBA15_001]|uniref:diacylglycerol/lipid kinase family protein n=1 Tax=Curtobacterium sp. MCBA15_001 TaxID=1898731 RepID=UPI0008DE9D19|nr:diacylglycerol kinase family protein [Curtobacterium sp. MCBA15_001]OIH97008.1 transcriptional regulator [Curtobacterium sp. MCBA15_001]